MKIYQLYIGLTFGVSTFILTSCTSLFVENPPLAMQVVSVNPVPEYYTWDGHEYVGLIEDKHFYLTPEGTWKHCDNIQLNRFRHWEHKHADWLEHATHNPQYIKPSNQSTNSAGRCW